MTLISVGESFAVMEAAMALLRGSVVLVPLLLPRLPDEALSVVGAELVRWYGRVGVEGCELARLRGCSSDENSPSPLDAEKSALLVGEWCCCFCCCCDDDDGGGGGVLERGAGVGAGLLIGVVVAVDGGSVTIVGCACETAATEGMGTIVGVFGMELVLLLVTGAGVAGGIAATVAWCCCCCCCCCRLDGTGAGVEAGAGVVADSTVAMVELSPGSPPAPKRASTRLYMLMLICAILRISNASKKANTSMRTFVSNSSKRGGTSLS